MAQFGQRTFTALTTAGSTAFVDLSAINPISGSWDYTLVAPASLVARVDYSNDGSTVAASSAPLPANSVDGTVSLPISTAYRFTRLTWVSGTGTSLTPTLNLATN